MDERSQFEECGNNSDNAQMIYAMTREVVLNELRGIQKKLNEVERMIKVYPWNCSHLAINTNKPVVEYMDTYKTNTYSGAPPQKRMKYE